MDLYEKRCTSCTKDTPTLRSQQATEFLQHLNDWSMDKEVTRIEKKFRFQTYLEGLDFVYSVGKIAEEQGHHPDVYLGYKRARISLTTYTAGGLTENDFILASKIDRVVSSLNNNSKN